MGPSKGKAPHMDFLNVMSSGRLLNLEVFLRQKVCHYSTHARGKFLAFVISAPCVFGYFLHEVQMAGMAGGNGTTPDEVATKVAEQEVYQNELSRRAREEQKHQNATIKQMLQELPNKTAAQKLEAVAEAQAEFIDGQFRPSGPSSARVL
jgi:hypothetical protein